jgi:hypothetical protein
VLLIGYTDQERGTIKRKPKKFSDARCSPVVTSSPLITALPLPIQRNLKTTSGTFIKSGCKNLYLNTQGLYETDAGSKTRRAHKYIASQLCVPPSAENVTGRPSRRHAAATGK